MSGFRKAKAEQAALKIGIYGPTGSGKTFSSLLMAEGLARMCGRRIAFVDTERGTDFYTKEVAQRKTHPEAFDFDAIYTRSLVDTLRECRKLDPKEHCCIVIDSITHLWESAIAAYGGNKTRAGTIPMHAWGSIKRPYKELMNWALNSPLHVFICGRQVNEFAEDESGELKNVGVKMKAEGETPYEPHILIRLEPQKPQIGKGKRAEGQALTVPAAFVEKDRTGLLFGQLIPWPNFENIIKPLVPLLGANQAQMASEEETASADADALAASDRAKENRSRQIFDDFRRRMLAASNREELAEIEKSLTPSVKRDLLTVHLNELRTVCLDSRQAFSNKTDAV